MTRPSKNGLVLDGSDVKVRLLAERQASKSVVHVDWVRFTVQRRNSPAPHVDLVFPPPVRVDSVWDADSRAVRLQKTLALLPDPDYAAGAQAWELAGVVAAALGPDFHVNAELRKGHDFYRYRFSIERHGVECGWAGYLSSSDHPRQTNQARTIHVNLYGAACTFAAVGWNDRLADICDERDADLTRCDLALDFFDGLDGGGIEGVRSAYMAGLCDVGGRRLRCNMVGDWCNNRERSFYFGSMEAGKQTNVYEKGHQLFGAESGSVWLRAELRYGNKLRVLSSDMLRRPADFFACASDWHAAMLRKADQVVTPEPVKTTPRLAVETVKAECVRVSRWLLNVAAPACATAFEFLGDEFLELVTNKKRPGRLQRFTPSELSRGSLLHGRVFQPLGVHTHEHDPTHIADLLPFA